MFDGIRLTFTDLEFVTNLQNNELFSTKRMIDAYGELQAYTAEFKGFKIKSSTNGYTVIKGSLHKFINDGKHNHNDFSIVGLKNVIILLGKELNLKAEIAILSNLEFGVNIKTEFNPNRLLEDLIRYKDKRFNLMSVQGTGNGRTCSYKQYEVKIYNKGLQYNVSTQLLRIEKKIIRMCALNYGKLYLNDLLDNTLWRHCKAELIKLIDSITFNEQLTENLLNKQQYEIYNALPNNAKWSSYSRNKKSRCKKVFNKIIAIYGTENYRKQLIKLVDAKCDELGQQNGTVLHYN
jgi:hypothetical protein